MLNKVILIGRIGKTPKIRHTGTGKAVTTISVATSRQWRDRDGNKQKQTEWHNVVAWGRHAEIIGEWTGKGSLICVEGRLQTRSWESDGTTRYTTEVVLEELKMLDGSNSGSRRPTAGRTAAQASEAGAGFDDVPGFGDAAAEF